MLFTDVVGSMDIAAVLGPERLREVMGELFDRASAIVQRYGGTVDKFTGDGLMAVFGAPVALEDHAIRACRAALEIQSDVKGLAAELGKRDDVTLQLRIGLNSGEVIAGEIGSGALAYTAVGEQVGMAQRMESVAIPGGVMVSESTARLVERGAMLSEPEPVRIKGAREPVLARRLLDMSVERREARVEPTFVGREWELGALGGLLTRSINGNGSVVGVVGPPGMGKSRLVRETAKLAKDRRVDVFFAYCESHTKELPFHAVTALLREATGVSGLDDAAARAQVRDRLAGADSEDMLLLEDLLGIGDIGVRLPQIDPDARRRRLTAMLNAALIARTTPGVYVIEDAHWIDEMSESMVAEFLAVIPRTRSMAVITYRPEYVGALTRMPRAQTISLEPLDDSQMSLLSTELLGEHASVASLADVIAERAAGNPFFTEELVRDLSERNVLMGRRGAYECTREVSNISVPSTLYAAIAARIDRLEPAAKRTLNGAAVIGSRFAPETLKAIDIDAALEGLVGAELIDQVTFAPRIEYAFRHPMIRTVAYESQLRSHRAQLHRRLAETIEQDDRNAALIAEHLESAGDLREAYEWHMRAGAWLTNRDTAAAHLSWERARQVADALPPDEPGRMTMRIAPRTALCGSMWRRFHPDMSSRFDELRALCAQADDKVSLAVGMAGMTVEYVLQGRAHVASELASEYMAMVESMGDPELVVGLSFAAIVAKFEMGKIDDVLRWAQDVIDLSDGDPARGGFILGSPLTVALAWRGLARWLTADRRWREDFDDARELAKDTDALSHATAIAYLYLGISRGVLAADDDALSEIAAALTVAERSSDDLALVLIRMIFAMALIHDGADRQRGYGILRELRETCVREGFALNVVPFFETYLALETAEGGNPDRAIANLRAVADEVLRHGSQSNVDLTLRFMVELLIARGELEQAESGIERIRAFPLDAAPVARDLTVLHLTALLARARGDEATHREMTERHRAIANQLGFDGDMGAAAVLP